MLGSGLKVIFHLFTQAFILLKSLFKSVADKFILSTAEKSETLSAKSQVKGKINETKEKKSDCIKII